MKKAIMRFKTGILVAILIIAFSVMFTGCGLVSKNSSNPSIPQDTTNDDKTTENNENVGDNNIDKKYFYVDDESDFKIEQATTVTVTCVGIRKIVNRKGELGYGK